MSQRSTTPLRQCIWCRRLTTDREPPEHIVPEAIGCPEDFVLRNGEVCASCNHGLGHLDQALVQDLEVYAAMAGVPSRKGRSSRISGYGNVVADQVGGKLTYFFNMGSTPVEIRPGKMLPGFRGKARDLKAHMKAKGGKAEITFDVGFGESPKVARALVKLGAEYLCWGLGPEIAAAVIQGPIADFVIHGRGYRPVVLFSPDKSKYEHVFEHLVQTEEGHHACMFRLAHMHVMVDLTPNLSAFPGFASALYQMHGRKTWTTLPLDAVSTVGDDLVVRRA